LQNKQKENSLKPKNHKNCRCLVAHLAMPFVHHPKAEEKHGESRGKAAEKQRKAEKNQSSDCAAAAQSAFRRAEKILGEKSAEKAGSLDCFRGSAKI